MVNVLHFDSEYNDKGSWEARVKELQEQGVETHSTISNGIIKIRFRTSEDWMKQPKELRLVLPRFGQPRFWIKLFPKGSLIIMKNTTFFVNNRWIEKRKRPIYEVRRVTGFIDMDGTFGCCGLNTRIISKHYNLTIALNKIE